MEVTGKVKVIFETQTFDSGFTKREFVVTTNEQYPQDIKVELIKDKCDLIDAYPVGSDVKVSINLRGNEFNGKYFVNIQGWRIEKNSSQGTEEKAPQVEEESDLPF